MATDLISSSLRTEDEQPSITSRNRLQTSPNFLFKRIVDDSPDVKLTQTIIINNDYFNPDFILNRKEEDSLNLIISSFFTRKQLDETPYTDEEWGLILGDQSCNQINMKKVCSCLQNGLPEDCRKEIWFYLAETQKLREEHRKRGSWVLSIIIGFILLVSYENLTSQTCLHKEKIAKDISRTFEDDEFFKDNKKEKLTSIKEILQAYANLDPEVGYTQGMNFLVGMLLCLIQNEELKDSLFHISLYHHLEKREKRGAVAKGRNTEEDVFWVFVYIMQVKNWRTLYTGNTPKLQELLDKLDLKIKEHLPNLDEIITKYVKPIG